MPDFTQTDIDNAQDAAYEAAWSAITESLGIDPSTWPGDTNTEAFCDALREFISITITPIRDRGHFTFVAVAHPPRNDLC